MFTVWFGAVVTEIIADGTQCVYSILSTKPEDLCDSKDPPRAQGTNHLVGDPLWLLNPVQRLLEAQKKCISDPLKVLLKKDLCVNAFSIAYPLFIVFIFPLSALPPLRWLVAVGRSIRGSSRTMSRCPRRGCSSPEPTHTPWITASQPAASYMGSDTPVSLYPFLCVNIPHHKVDFRSVL